MRKILVAVEHINPSGGVTQSVLALLRKLAVEGVDVTLLVARPRASCLDGIPNQVRVIEGRDDLAWQHPRAVLKHLLKEGPKPLALYLWALARMKLTRNLGAYHSFFLSRFEAVPGRYEVAAVYSMLDSFAIHVAAESVVASRRVMWCPTDTSLYGRELHSLERVFSRFDAVNCISTGSQASFVQIFPSLSSRTRVRHSLFDEQAIRSLAKDPRPPVQFRRENVIEIATVARISREKGIDLLLDAASRLKEGGYSFIWTVVGPDHNPSFAAEVRAQWKSRGLETVVHFVGGQSNPYPWMASCDIYVQPSRVEGFCRATMEARILGKAVIRTDTPGASDQFQHGINGSIVPPTGDAIAREVARLIDNPDIRHRYESALAVHRNGGESSLDVGAFL